MGVWRSRSTYRRCIPRSISLTPSRPTVPIAGVGQFVTTASARSSCQWRASKPLSWCYEDLARIITVRLVLARPIIAEGICLCQPLQAIDRDPDSWVWVENLGSPKPEPSDPTSEYVAEFNLEANADYTLTWKRPEVGFG